MRHAWLIAPLFLLAACDSIGLPSWLEDDEKPPLPGERLPILRESRAVKADESLKDTVLSLPEAQVVESWPQAMGNSASHLEHLALNPMPVRQQSAKIGEGNGWAERLFTVPVVAGQVLFAMDAKGYISAHLAGDVERVYWTSEAAIGKDEPDILGGGLAFDNGVLFAVTGYGRVVALSPADGRQFWSQNLGVPVRVAPKAANGKLIVLSVDNQTIALSQDTGETLWTHRGISETAGFISDISPSVQGEIAVTPYSSGQITALGIADGKELWSDTLIFPKRTAANSIFAGIGGAPVIVDGTVYAVSNNGLLAATDLTSGRRLWEQEISSTHTPWVAGDYLFVLSTSHVLFGISRADGRIKWLQQLPQYEDEEDRKGPVLWHGPVLAGGKLWLAGEHGLMLGINPQTGVTESAIDIPDGVIATPIVASGVMYLLTKDATVVAYK